MQAVALTVLLVGAVASLALVLNAGRNTPVLLLILFIGWVLSPFIGFFIASQISRRWSIPTRTAIYWLILIVTPVSLVGYSGAFNSPHTKPAFIFLVVPFISWLLILTVILIALRLSRKVTNKS